MAVTVETLEKLQRKITLSIPVAEVQQEVEKRLKNLARKIKMDGFRPGKVPMHIVAGQYGPSVQYEVINEKVGEAFYRTAEEAGVRVAGQPTINEKDGAAEGHMLFEALFEVFPDVDLGDLSTLEVERVVADVDDAAIERTIEILRKQRRTFSQRAQDEVAQDGDRATIDCEGKIDGELFEGGKLEGFQYLVGEGQMLEEFENAVRGMKVGESKTFPLTFPQDYHGKDVAGKTADFMLTLKKLEAAHLPEVDDAFAASLGIADSTVEGLRSDIRKNLDREVKYRVLARNKEAVMNALLARTEQLDLPQVSVDVEVGRMLDDLKQRGLKDTENLPFPQEVLREQAQRRVKLGLIVADLVRVNKLVANAEEIKAHIQNLAASYEKPQDVVSWYYKDEGRIADVGAIVTENKAVEFVLNKAKVTDKVLGFTELMEQAV